MNRPILIGYQLIIGLSDTLTGALLIIAPEFALRQMRIDDRLFDERRTFLEGREGDFKRGTASEADLNDARISFNNAQISAFSSRAGYLQRLGDLLGLIMEDPVLQQIITGAHE